MKISTGKKAVIIILILLVLDQALKVWIKTNMVIGQEFAVIGNWFIIHFTENNGMAFGVELGGELGKLVLTIFRLAAVAAIGWWINTLTRNKAPEGFILSVSLIMAGAIGNIIDSTFYGLIFEDSYFKISSFLPAGGGYAPLFYGRVVDMFYFPVLTGNFPDWIPLWGGEEFIFFRPVFNLADSAICVGVFMIFIFHRKYLLKDEKAVA